MTDQRGMTTLSQVVDVLDSRRVPVNSKERAERSGVVPYYGATGRVGWIDEPIFDEDLVLLGEDGVQFFDRDKPKAYLVSGPAWVNNHAHVLRTKSDVDRRWLCHWLNYVDYRGFANGTTRLKLTQASMRRLPVWAPPVDEQRRLVAVLEDHLSRLDAADDYLAASLRRVAALQRSTLQAVIDAPGRPRRRLADAVLRLEAGKSLGGSAPPARLDEWGIVKVSSMTWGAFRAEENKAIDPSAVVRRYEIAAGDLLISRANTTAYVGAAVLVPEGVRPRLLLSDKSLRVIPEPETSAPWLRLALSTPAVRAQISARASGTKDSMRNISQGALLTVSVPAVDRLTQAEDVQHVMQAQGAVARLEEAIRLATRRHAALRRALLTAAFTGRLTGRSSDMDIAEELAEAAS